jgi:hypothetical protein
MKTKLEKYCRDPQFQNKQPLLYFVTTVRKNEDTRCIGYYLSLKVARDVIKNNVESLCEAGYYQYIVIEAFGPG